MKKLIALSAILSLSAAFAKDVVYGTFVLNSSEPELILGVPWINPGSTDGAIKVEDLIQTSTLEAGDQLFYYAGGSYKAWAVNNEKAWEAANSVNDITVIEPTGNETLTRGNAIILKRVNMNTSRNKTIVINGQVGTEPVEAMTMAKGTKTTPAYTLVAPSSATETALNAGNWTNVGSGDMIAMGLSNGKIGFYYFDTKEKVWGTRKVNATFSGYDITDAAAKIPAGQGVWFVSDGSEGESAVTCQW